MNTFLAQYHHFCHILNAPIQTHLMNSNPDMLLLDCDKLVKDEDWSPLLKALKRNRNLTHIQLHSSHPKPILQRILPDLVRSVFIHQLYHLHLTGIPISDTCLDILTKGLVNKNICHLTHLTLANIQLGDSGVLKLSSCLRTLKSLKCLNLSANSITEKGAHILATLLKSLAVRRQSDCWEHSLRLSPMDQSPLAPLASSRKAIKPLKRLIMCHNKLGDEGAIPLLDLLVEDVGLSCLDLQFNDFTEVTARKAIDILKSNRDLVILDFRNNHISSKTLGTIKNYLEINTRAIRVKLKEPFQDPDLEWLDEKYSFAEPVKVKRTIAHTQSSVQKICNSHIVKIKEEKHNSLFRAKDNIVKNPKKIRVPIPQMVSAGKKSVTTKAIPMNMAIGDVIKALDKYYEQDHKPKKISSSLTRRPKKSKVQFLPTSNSASTTMQQENQKLRFHLEGFEKMVEQLESQTKDRISSIPKQAEMKPIELNKSELPPLPTKSMSITEWREGAAIGSGEVIPQNIQHILSMLESSLAGFHKVLDELQIN